MDVAWIVFSPSMVTCFSVIIITLCLFWSYYKHLWQEEGDQMRNKAKDFGKTADIQGPKSQSEAVRSNGSINSEPQERMKENR